jgi:hypothetical protein
LQDAALADFVAVAIGKGNGEIALRAPVERQRRSRKSGQPTRCPRLFGLFVLIHYRLAPPRSAHS